jgi:hypothetical protein
VAVSDRSPLDNASLEVGSITWATTIATARSRQRDGAGLISSSTPRARSVPTTAATWPWGRLRLISNAPSSVAAGGRPLSTRDSASTLSGGQRVRLANVRLRTLPPSR